MNSVDSLFSSFDPFRTDVADFDNFDDYMDNPLLGFPSPFESSGSTSSTPLAPLTPLFAPALTIDPGSLQKSPEPFLDSYFPWESNNKRKRAMSSSHEQEDPSIKRRRASDQISALYSPHTQVSDADSRAGYLPAMYPGTQMRTQSYPSYYPAAASAVQYGSHDNSLSLPDASSASWGRTMLPTLGSGDSRGMKQSSPGVIADWSPAVSYAAPPTGYSPAYSPSNSFNPHQPPRQTSYSYPGLAIAPEEQRQMHHQQQQQQQQHQQQQPQQSSPQQHQHLERSDSATSYQALPSLVAHITAQQRQQHAKEAAMTHQHQDSVSSVHSHHSHLAQSPELERSPSNPESSREKLRCYEHGCNGRVFSTFSNLLRHQREKEGRANKSSCPRCGAEFTRTTARNSHLQHAKCKARRDSELSDETAQD